MYPPPEFPGKNSLHEFPAPCAAHADERTCIARRREEREGTELMLFCMGNLSLRRGQHIGICLFEPRYRMMVAKALANDGKFGIVVDSCGFRAGARGRVVSIMYQRQRPDGCYDVVVSVGPSFTVSDRMWAVQPPSAPAHSPALMHTRAKIAEAEEEEEEGEEEGMAMEADADDAASVSSLSAWGVITRARSQLTRLRRTPSPPRGNASSRSPNRSPSATRQRASPTVAEEDAASHRPSSPDEQTPDASPDASPASSGSASPVRVNSTAAMGAVRSLRGLLRRAVATG